MHQQQQQTHQHSVSSSMHSLKSPPQQSNAYTPAQQQAYQAQIQQLQSMIRMVKLEAAQNPVISPQAQKEVLMPRQMPQQQQQYRELSHHQTQKVNEYQQKASAISPQRGSKKRAVENEKPQLSHSPSKMVVLAADSHEMLAQLMRASASLIVNQQAQFLSENSSNMSPQNCSTGSPCKRLTPFRERHFNNSESVGLNCSPPIMKLYSIQEETPMNELEEYKRDCCHGQKRSNTRLCAQQQRNTSPQQDSFQMNQSPNKANLQRKSYSPQRNMRQQSPPLTSDRLQNDDPIVLAKHQASNLFELGLQMSQTALSFLQTVIQREKQKQARKKQREDGPKQISSDSHQRNYPMQLPQSNFTLHPHFATLQLSEVKQAQEASNFIDDPRSPQQHLFSALNTAEKHGLSRSKSHAKRVSADWTSSHKKDFLNGVLLGSSCIENDSQVSSSQQNSPNKMICSRLGRAMSGDTFSLGFNNNGGQEAVENASVNQSYKQSKEMLKVREEKIKEFTQMNEKLNEMKEKFKRELLKNEPEELLMKVAPQHYLDQQLSQMSKTFGDRRKHFLQSDKQTHSQVSFADSTSTKQQVTTQSFVTPTGSATGTRKSSLATNTNVSSQKRMPFLDGPLQVLPEIVKTTKAQNSRAVQNQSLSRPSIKNSQNTVVKTRPELSFDSVQKSRQGALSQLLLSANRRLNNSVLKRPENIAKRQQERSLSKVSITNAKIQVKSALSKKGIKPMTVSAFSPTSSVKGGKFDTFNKTIMEKGSLLLGGADIPMFKTTQNTAQKTKTLTQQPSRENLKKTLNFSKSGKMSRASNGSMIREPQTVEKRVTLNQAMDEIKQQRQSREKLFSASSSKPLNLKLGNSNKIKQQLQVLPSRLSVGANEQQIVRPMTADPKSSLKAPRKSAIVSNTLNTLGTLTTLTLPSVQPTAALQRKRSQNSMHGDLAQQLAFAGDKLNHYRKLINFTQIIDFKRQGIAQKRNQKDTESKACIRAARCLCMLLEAFYVSEGSHHYGPTMSFESWSEICGFIHRHSHRIVADINGGLQEKIDQAKNNQMLQEVMSPSGYETLMKIYTDIFLMEAADFQKTNMFPLASPRVRNLQYKPVFCFVYFLITYFMIKKRMTESHPSGSQHSLHAININIGGEIIPGQLNITENSAPQLINKSIKTVGKSSSKEKLNHHQLQTVTEKAVKRQKTPESIVKSKSNSPNKTLQQSVQGFTTMKKLAKAERKKKLAQSFDCSASSKKEQHLPQLLMASQVLDETQNFDAVSPIKHESPQAKNMEDISPQTEIITMSRVESLPPAPQQEAPQQIILSKSEKELEKQSVKGKKDEVNKSQKDGLIAKHPYLQHTIRPLNSISRLLNSHQSMASIKSGQHTFGLNKQSSRLNMSTASHRSQSHRSIDKHSPNHKFERESARVRKQIEKKQRETKVFEELEKEVEHQFQQLQLAYGIVNQSSILDSSLASLKSSLLNMNPMQSGSATQHKQLSMYKASSAQQTAQITPSASSSQLRASVSFSGGNNGMLNPVMESQEKSFSFVKHGSAIRQSVSNANTSFSSKLHHPQRESHTTSIASGNGTVSISIHQQRREIVDRLIDNRKRSAEKRQMLQLQQQMSMVDPSLDENAWQMIQELGRQQQQMGQTQKGVPEMIPKANLQYSQTSVLSGSSSQRRKLAATSAGQQRRVRD